MEPLVRWRTRVGWNYSMHLMDARCNVVSSWINYVSQVWDEIVCQEGSRTGCANQCCFFGKLVYCFTGRYACVTEDPLESDVRAFRRACRNFESQQKCQQQCQDESVEKEGGGVLKKGQSFFRKDSLLEGQILETIPDIISTNSHFFTLFLKNSYFGSLLPEQSIYKTYFPSL